MFFHVRDGQEVLSTVLTGAFLLCQIIFMFCLMFEEQVKTIKSLVTYGTLMVPGNAIICKYGWGRDRASRLLFNLLLNSNFSFSVLTFELVFMTSTMSDEIVFEIEPHVTLVATVLHLGIDLLRMSQGCVAFDFL